MNRKSLLTVSLLIVLAVATRLLPHPHNFAPIGGVALFGAAWFRHRISGFVIPLVAMWLSDLYINNVTYAAYNTGFVWLSDGFYWMYGSFALISLMGLLLFREVTPGRVMGGAIASSLLFFLITNFGVWLSSSVYPQTMNGLVTCYAAGIPFYWNTLAGDLVYSGVLFGAAYGLQRSHLLTAVKPA
jgi:hypothetical protein